MLAVFRECYEPQLNFILSRQPQSIERNIRRKVHNFYLIVWREPVTNYSRIQVIDRLENKMLYNLDGSTQNSNDLKVYRAVNWMKTIKKIEIPWMLEIRRGQCIAGLTIPERDSIFTIFLQHAFLWLSFLLIEWLSHFIDCFPGLAWGWDFDWHQKSGDRPIKFLGPKNNLIMEHTSTFSRCSEKHSFKIFLILIWRTIEKKIIKVLKKKRNETPENREKME